MLAWTGSCCEVYAIAVKEALTCLALRNGTLRRSGAGLCLALFLLLQLFAVCGSLHERIHADSSLPGHHCVITLVAQGDLSAPASLTAFAIIVSIGFCLPLLLRVSTLSSFDYRLSPSRAPPRF